MSKCIRLYHFYNLDQDSHGKPFAKCDAHIDAWKRGRKPAAPQLVLEKLADQAVWPCEDCTRQEIDRSERRRFAAAAKEPSVSQKEPIWSVVLKNKRASMDGINLQSDGWSYRYDLSDIDQDVYEVIAKTQAVREL
jgi:hypothetical protein